MAKTWDQMSKDERKSSGLSKQDYNAKHSLGKQAARSEAKERAENHAAQPKPGSALNAGLSPIQQQMLDRKNAQKEAQNTKQDGLAKANAYLQQGGSRDAQYDQMLKDAGANNNDMNQYQNTQRQQKAADNKQSREAENAAYKNYHQDMKTMRESSGGSAQRKVDQSAHYQHMMNTEGGYGGNQAHNEAVKQLMGTGQKFSNLDVQREMGASSTYNQDGLFKAYGGYENYKQNHSVGSGNWESRIPQAELGTMKEADDAQRQHFADKNTYFNSGEFDSNYGQYDWAQKAKQRSAEQGAKFDKSFDDRQDRMQQSGYGSVYGY